MGSMALSSQCPRCGWPTTVGIAFCPRCGSPLIEAPDRRRTRLGVFAVLAVMAVVAAIVVLAIFYTLSRGLVEPVGGRPTVALVAVDTACSSGRCEGRVALASRTVVWAQYAFIVTENGTFRFRTGPLTPGFGQDFGTLSFVVHDYSHAGVDAGDDFFLLGIASGNVYRVTMHWVSDDAELASLEFRP